VGKSFSIIYRGNRWVGEKPGRSKSFDATLYFVLTGGHTFGMRTLPFRGVCRVSARVKTWGRDASGEVLLWERGRPSMKPVKKADQAAVRHLAAMETNMFREHMGIIEHLALLQYDDGSPRSTGRLIVDVRGSAWSVICKDVESGMQLVCIGATLDDALDTLQLHLGSDNAPWEPDPWAKDKPAKKPRK